MKNTSSPKKVLPAGQRDRVLALLAERFAANPRRHRGLEWTEVQARLEANPGKLWTLNEMEHTGGEPDVVSVDEKTGEYLFFDCSPESPKGRTSVCYDREGLDSRKEQKPKSSALDMAAEMGVELLTEDQYRALQELGEFDTKTSSWLVTPAAVRKLGGCAFRRPSLRPCLRVSQWRAIILRGARISRSAEGLGGTSRHRKADTDRMPAQWVVEGQIRQSTGFVSFSRPGLRRGKA